MTPLLEPQAAYAMFDGLFEKALLGYLSGDAEAAALLAERVRWLLPQICPAAPPPGRLSLSASQSRPARGRRYPGPMTYRSLLLGQPR